MQSPYSLRMLVSALLIGASLNVTAQNHSVQLQRSDGSVAAKPIYAGDYYHAANGDVIKLFRKEGVFVLPSNGKNFSGFSQQSTKLSKQNIDFSAVEKHNLPGAHVVRMSLRAKRQKNTANAPQNTMPGMMPVFTTDTGMGDLLLLPEITLRIEDNADASKILAEIGEELGLTVVRQLAVTGHVYSLQASNRLTNVAQQFATVRELMNIEGVRWAEPQFYMQAQREQFVPADSLYTQQWHLNNGGYRGSRCDVDCDAAEAWAINSGGGAATGVGMIVAVIDDGVQTNHPDLLIASGGRDFVEDGSDSSVCGHDGDDGPDNDPNPSPDINCTAGSDELMPDNHGTAVAGLIAARQNGLGVVGAAFNASILPIRALSDYDTMQSSVCNRLAEAVSYAAQKAHVINLSWSLPTECMALTEAIVNATQGDVMADVDGTQQVVSLRPNLGSPVVVASGNNASGWIKVTVPVSAGEHAYEWRYLRSDLPDESPGIDDTVWIDDISWPDGSIEDFDSLSSFTGTDFTTAWVLNSCNAECEFNFGDEPVWGINTNPIINYVRSGTNAASLLASDSDCGNSYLHTLRNDPAGEISFWVWVSATTRDDFDKFEFLVDGQEAISYGDVAAFGFVDNRVAYPANLSNRDMLAEAGVIAVGASTSGDLSGQTIADPSAEYRAPYSQFGPTLDVVSPSSDQHLGVTTTDRFETGASDNLGFNTDASSDDIASDRRFTQNFTGTSASAATVSGIAAALIASEPSASAQLIKDTIKSAADQIGNVPYVDGRNDQFGDGRVNMYKAVRSIRGESTLEPAQNCSVPAPMFDYQVASDRLLPRYQPQESEGFCPAQGPLPEPNDLCFPVPTQNNRVVVICL